VGAGEAEGLSDARPAATDGTNRTNMSYMSYWSYKSYSGDAPMRHFEHEDEHYHDQQDVGTPWLSFTA
jgi:hypothetical protein